MSRLVNQSALNLTYLFLCKISGIHQEGLRELWPRQYVFKMLLPSTCGWIRKLSSTAREPNCKFLLKGRSPSILLSQVTLLAAFCPPLPNPAILCSFGPFTFPLQLAALVAISLSFRAQEKNIHLALYCKAKAAHFFLLQLSILSIIEVVYLKGLLKLMCFKSPGK